MSDGGWDHDRILCDCGRRALYGWPWCERCSGRYPGVFDQPVPLPADTELEELVGRESRGGVEGHARDWTRGDARQIPGPPNRKDHVSATHGRSERVPARIKSGPRLSVPHKLSKEK